MYYKETLMKKKVEFLSELKKLRESYDYTNEISNKLVNNCTNIIKIINKTGTTNYLYEVPSFLLGYHIYDTHTIAMNVNKKLKKKGLSTVYNAPNKIYISW